MSLLIRVSTSSGPVDVSFGGCVHHLILANDRRETGQPLTPQPPSVAWAGRSLTRPPIRAELLSRPPSLAPPTSSPCGPERRDVTPRRTRSMTAGRSRTSRTIPRSVAPCFKRVLLLQSRLLHPDSSTHRPLFGIGTLANKSDLVSCGDDLSTCHWNTSCSWSQRGGEHDNAARLSKEQGPSLSHLPLSLTTSHSRFSGFKSSMIPESTQ